MPELDLDDIEDYYLRRYIISPEAEADAADTLPAIQRRISEIYHHTVMQELLNP